MLSNLKIKVGSEAESKEAQELFFELGCEWYVSGVEFIDTLDVIVCEGGLLTHCSTEYHIDCGKNHKELTIPQLRDMVVLKRNDVNDRTHVDSTGCDYYKDSNGDFYYKTTRNWKITREIPECIEPIQKKEMKEFLVNHDGKWTLQLLDSGSEENSYRVAVPSGADVAYFFSASDLNSEEDDIAFYKNSLNFIFQRDGYWEENGGDIEFIKSKGRIIWQRSETKSLNDQYAEIKKVRQDAVKVTIDELKHHVYKKDVSHLDSIDVYRVLELFNVQSHAVGHAIKKLLCSGGRGAKDEAQDIQEAIDSLVRYREMKKEDDGEDCVSIDW